MRTLNTEMADTTNKFTANT